MDRIGIALLIVAAVLVFNGTLAPPTLAARPAGPAVAEVAGGRVAAHGPRVLSLLLVLEALRQAPAGADSQKV